MTEPPAAEACLRFVPTNILWASVWNVAGELLLLPEGSGCMFSTSTDASTYVATTVLAKVFRLTCLLLLKHVRMSQMYVDYVPTCRLRMLVLAQMLNYWVVHHFPRWLQSCAAYLYCSTFAHVFYDGYGHAPICNVNKLAAKNNGHYLLSMLSAPLMSTYSQHTAYKQIWTSGNRLLYNNGQR